MKLHSSHMEPMRRMVIIVALLAFGVVLVWALPVLPGMAGIANYLPLHMLLETFAVVVSMLIFAVGWHAHSRNLPGNIVLLACAFFGVGLLDFAHILSYAGMPDFVTPSNAEKGIDFWLVARSLAALALLAVVVMPWRPFVSSTTRYALFTATLAATAFAYWLILFHQGKLPHTFVPGQGLTAFKIASEYLLITLNLAAALMLWQRMRKPLAFNAAALFGALCTMALSEFLFTLYTNLTDIYNLLGHIYKGISYLFLYRAIFVSTVEVPYRQLYLSQSKLRGTLDAIPDLMWLKDADGVYIECNATFERLYGAKKTDIIGKTDYDFVDRGLADFFREHDRKAMTADKPSVNEEWLTFAKGGYRGLFETVKTPMYGKTGNLIGVLGIARDITKREQAEEALHRSETRLRTLYDSTSDAVMLLDKNGFFDCNKATLAMFGCGDKEEFCSKHPADLSPPEQPCGIDSMTLASRQIATAMKQCNHQFEWMHKRADTGMVFHAEVLLNSMVLDDKKVLQATVRDITERKHAEDTQRKLYQVVEQSPSSIVITDSNANIEYVNQAFVRETGYSLADVIGKNPRVLNSGKNPKEAYKEMWSCLKRGEAWRGELINRRKDGSEYVELAVISPVRLADGSVTNYLAIKENITARKADEAKIKRLSQMYRLLSRVNEAIVRAGDKNLLFEAVCNATMESGLFRLVWIGMADKSERRVIPIACSGIEEGYLAMLDIRLDDERCREWPIVTAIRENTHVIRQDIEHIQHLAPWRDVALKRGLQSGGMFPICESGAAAGTMNVYSTDKDFFTPDIVRLMLELTADISFALDVFAEKERRKQMAEVIIQLNTELEHRVRERTNQLEDANKELEAFSYSVSHDLRAPLRSIDGFSRNLSKKYHDQLDATGQDWLERICRASQHMGHLIDDMLKLSQVTRGTLKREQTDLSKIAENVADGLSKTNSDRQVRFIIQQDLPVQADTGLMRIVMDNLLGNAYKFTGKKSNAEIEFGARAIDGEEIAFFVRDNGDGFNMDYAHKLFGTFQRLHTANEFEGTGIGLATVQRVIHRHNGKVWAEGKEGQGATFYFTLPQRERGGGGALMNRERRNE
ncbi:MAG: MASE3 domain-containing protein [Gallionella sp.]|nr:MASE3 domain-containing protein [Gallionella sp.]